MAEMAVRKKRPKNLDLMTIRLPMPGILSIVHRISGAGIFLMLPVLLWLLQGSLASPETFDAVLAVLAHPFAKLILLGLVWFYLHHFCAGIRYLLLDLHVGVDLPAARRSSAIVFAVSIVLTLFIAARLLW
jgi:succinate dehydrogenase / fumarate reductase cytochrome b subunit